MLLALNGQLQSVGGAYVPISIHARLHTHTTSTAYRSSIDADAIYYGHS